MPFDLFPAHPRQTNADLSRIGVECVVCNDSGQPARRRVFSISALLDGLRLS